MLEADLLTTQRNPRNNDPQLRLLSILNHNLDWRNQEHPELHRRRGQLTWEEVLHRIHQLERLRQHRMHQLERLRQHRMHQLERLR